MLDFGSVVKLPSVGAAPDGGLSSIGKRSMWSQSPAGGKGGHLLEHQESSFCFSNMPTMSKQQLHKAGVSIHQSHLEVALSSQLGWNWKFLLRGQAALGYGDAGSPPSRLVKSNVIELRRSIVRGQKSGPCELQALQEGVILQTNSLER